MIDSMDKLTSKVPQISRDEATTLESDLGSGIALFQCFPELFYYIHFWDQI